MISINYQLSCLASYILLHDGFEPSSCLELVSVPPVSSAYCINIQNSTGYISSIMKLEMNFSTEKNHCVIETKLLQELYCKLCNYT